MTAKREAAPAALTILHDAAVTYRYIAPRGHTIDDVKRSDYWRQNARELGTTRYVGERPWHKIEVIADDGSWEADLRVVSVFPDGLVETRCIRAWQSPKLDEVKMPKGYKVEHMSGKGWRVIDPAMTILAQGVSSEFAAQQVAIDHNRKVTA